jgi:hypothetical protein
MPDRPVDLPLDRSLGEPPSIASRSVSTVPAGTHGSGIAERSGPTAQPAER